MYRLPNQLSSSIVRQLGNFAVLIKWEICGRIWATARLMP